MPRLPAAVNSFATDLARGPCIALCGDVRAGLPLESDSMQDIASMHTLVELRYLDVVPALRELRRILEPGGVLWLGLSDLDRVIDACRTGDAGIIHDR